MAAVEINWNPTEKDLRWFAALQFLFFCIVAGLVWNRTDSLLLAGLPVALSFPAGVTGFVRPAWIRPYYLGWMLAVFPIGWTVSHLILAVVFFLVLTPIGLVLRLTGHDPMQRRPDPGAATWWQKRPKDSHPDRAFRQF